MTPLRFNVAGLLKENAGAARDYEVTAAPEELEGLLEDARPAAPLTGRLRMMRAPRSIFVRGRLKTAAAMECSRCLAEVTVPISFDVDAEFFPAIDISTGHALPAPDDDLAFTIDHNHELDLSDLVRQSLLLELPMHPLCSEECKGLCARCGTDLNEGDCTCGPEEPDERLAPLRALLEQQQKGSAS